MLGFNFVCIGIALVLGSAETAILSLGQAGNGNPHGRGEGMLTGASAALAVAPYMAYFFHNYS